MRPFLSSLCAIVLLTPNALAQAPPVLSSGLPVPRFVSLKFDRVYARTGPDPSYPIAWVYQRAGLPVEITQEYNDWRHIRDNDGGEGWVHKIQLSPKRTVLIAAAQPVAVTNDDDPSSAVVARLEPRVAARLDKCDDAACKVEGDGYEGWVERKFLWGIYPHEDFH